MKIQHVTEATGTQRECAVCNKPATKFGFASDRRGQKNKSSRTPLCEAHANETKTVKNLYRICTEDLNRPAIECVMQNAGLDCTIIPARGLFQGIPENALVIECVTNDRNAVEIAARAIVILNKQTCILVERLAVQAYMIGGKL